MTKSSKVISILLAVAMFIGMIPLTMLFASARAIEDPSKKFYDLQKQYVAELQDYQEAHDSVVSKAIIRRAIKKIENTRYDEEKDFDYSAAKITAIKDSAIEDIQIKDRIFEKSPFLRLIAEACEWLYEQIVNLFK